MEKMEVDSSDDRSKVLALGSINFKVGGKEVLEHLEAVDWPDCDINEIFSEWLKDLEREKSLRPYPARWSYKWELHRWWSSMKGAEPKMNERVYYKKTEAACPETKYEC